MQLTNVLFNELLKQINTAIQSLEDKIQKSPERYVVDVLKNYRKVKEALVLDGTSTELSVLKKLLNGARGYLETSSDYDQSFLFELEKTELLVKRLL